MFERTAGAGRWVRRIATVAAAAFFVFGAMTAQASAEVRTLKLYNVHTKERASFAYKRNGRYDRAEMDKINWFLRDWRKAKSVKMDPRLIDLVWEAYRQSGSRDYVHVICGYRSADTNNMLRGRSRNSGVARESQHTQGKAMDFYIPDVSLAKLRAIGLKMQVGGVGYYPRSGSPFVHLDVGNARHWPRMSRRELLAVFPSGNTIHVPSDGKPLPGYERALAAYQQRRGSSDLQVANATSTGGGRSLLSRIFGGGQEEADDEADVATAPAVRERPTAQPPAAVAAQKLPNGAAVPVPDTFDTNVPAQKPQAPAETEVAALANVPLPTAAPTRVAPAAAPSLAETTAVAALAKVPVPSDPAVNRRGDAVATLVAALEAKADDTVASGQMAYAVPTPAERPPFASVMGGEAASPTAAEIREAVAAIRPTGRPETKTIEAIAAAAQLPKQAAEAHKPALLKPAVATGKPATRVASLEPQPAVASVSTAAPKGKSGRLGRNGEAHAAVAPKAKAVDPADAIASRIAFAHIVSDPEDRAVASMKRPSADKLVSSLPESVFVAGFTTAANSGKSDRFSGKAVHFLPVANVK